MKKNLTLNNAFPIVAAALGNKFGVNISVGGSDAYTDGKIINIPAYNLDDPSYKDVAWGYLAHEAGHVRFSDFDVFRNAATTSIRKGIVNILEDIRIERLMQNTFPGTRLTTEKVVQHMIKTGGFEIAGQNENEKAHPADVLSQFLLFRLRNDILGQTALSAYADTAELLLETTFPIGAVTRLFGLLSEVPELKGTRDCVRLTDRILSMIKEENEKEQDKALQQQSQQQDSDDSSSTSNNDNLEDQDSGQFAQNLASVLSASDDDVPDDIFDIAKDILSSQPVNNYDSDIKLPIAMKPVLKPIDGNKLMSKVITESAKLKTSLQGLVQASRRVRIVHKYFGNRVDGRKLSRLYQGDSRVFEHRNNKKAPNTAIHLLLDGSTSMGDRPPGCDFPLMDLAIESALALTLALEGISGVNPAVTRFPFDNEGNVVTLLKHGEKVRLNTSNFYPFRTGNTPLHEALLYAASEVLSTREERKVIIVLTDGKPDDEDAAKAIIRRIEVSGIEIFSIGIFFDTSYLFRKSIVINNVSELRSELFRIGRDVLISD